MEIVKHKYIYIIMVAETESTKCQLLAFTRICLKSYISGYI
jgi:hypothetical protein